MIAKLINYATKIRLGPRTVAVGLAAFTVLAGVFLVVAYFSYR